jgi:Domain of unknown function (DUF4157)
MGMFEDDFLKAPKAPERAAPTSATQESRGTSSQQRMLQLQRVVGNSGVAQLFRGEDESASVQQLISGGGQPLEKSTAAHMGSALGNDFSDVRVHTGGDASASAQRLGAHAYTVGNDIVFNEGRYDPGSSSGQRTLAHELTHVVQQRSGPVDGTDNGSGVRVSDPSDKFEQAAEASADHVMSGGLGSADTASSGSSSSIQREDALEEQPVQEMAIQRDEAEEQEEPVQAMALQREDAEEQEEPVQAMALQREDAEEQEEPVQAMAIQREEAEEESVEE